MPILGECRVMRNLLIETEAREPAISQMHPDVLDQASFTGDSVQVSDQQNAEQDFGVNRRTTLVAVARLQVLAIGPAGISMKNCSVIRNKFVTNAVRLDEKMPSV